MTRSLSNSLLVPVETLNREFDGKLLLALLACQRGMRPIIGGRKTVHDNLHLLPRSIYLSSSVRTGNRLILSIIERLGHAIVALDEEALIRFSDEAFLMMFDAKTFNRPRILYSWGRGNSDVWRRFEGYGGAPILEVGNPRADMMTPRVRGYYAEDVARLRERFGRFVLLSSNFSQVNHYIPDHMRFRVAADAPAQRTRELKDGVYQHRRALFEQFQALVPRLAEVVRPHSLVIRPHPSESHQAWKELCEGFDNVHVLHEGPIAPWLMAAVALVHNGCTSAVEAGLLGTPAFAYCPLLDEEFDIELPNAVSMNRLSAESLLEDVGRAISDDGLKAELTPSQQAKLRHAIASIDGPLSCERILDSFETHREAIEGAPRATAGRRALGLAHHLGRRLDRAIRTRRQRSRSSAVYLAHKFPGISRGEVDRRIARFRSVLHDLPEMRARELRRDIFAIEKA